MEDLKKYLTIATNVLQKLCNIPSPSGFTDEVSREILTLCKQIGYTPEITKKNAIVCNTLSAGDTLTLAAHVDTLGAIVRTIKPNGRLRISKIGGWAENTVSGENCLVHLYNGKTISGTIQYTNPSVHTSRNVGKEKTEEEIEVVIDELCHSKKDVLEIGIETGNFVSLDTRFCITPGGFIKSRHLDDKAGSAILIALAHWIQDNKKVVKKNVQLLFTTYEEVGHGGSSDIPSLTSEMISVDMGSIGSDLEGSEEKVSICVKDSGGPYDYSITKNLIQTAKENKIAYAADVFPYYGSDVEASLRAGYSIKHGLIGPGVSSSHGYERTHEQGLLATIQLLIQYITR